MKNEFLLKAKENIKAAELLFQNNMFNASRQLKKAQEFVNIISEDVNNV